MKQQGWQTTATLLLQHSPRDVNEILLSNAAEKVLSFGDSKEYTGDHLAQIKFASDR